MSRRSWLANPAVWAGAAALGYAGMRALLGLDPRADEEFFNWKGGAPKGIDVGTARVDLPLFYYREDSFMAIFPADYAAVRAALPSPALYPDTLPDGRATIALMAFNYIETSLGPYGEIAVIVPCSYGRENPPLLSWLMESRLLEWGGYVLHLPVTTRLARDTGRTIWGYNKFVADMAFEKLPAYQCVRLEEGGQHIMTFTVQQRGLPIRDNRPMRTYSVKDGQLIRTTVPSRALYQLDLMPGTARLALGDHPVADQLRALGIGLTSIATKNYVSRAGVLPGGEALGAARPDPGYGGEDRDCARLTVRYKPTGEAADVHGR